MADLPESQENPVTHHVYKSSFSPRTHDAAAHYWRHLFLVISSAMSRLVKAAAIACTLPALVQGSKVPLASRQTLNTTCADIHYFEARGTTLSYPGSLITVIDPLMEAFPNSNYEDIVYPATDETGSDSYFVGVRDGAKQIISYAEACPESKIVLMGYSQGAMVLGDVLAGGGDGNILGNYTKPLVDARTVGDHSKADYKVWFKDNLLTSLSSRSDLAVRQPPTHAESDLQRWQRFYVWCHRREF